MRQAFTEVLAGRYERSWAGVAQALEDASGIEAHGYVTLWLASDVRPSLDVRWRHDPERGVVVARVDSDAPYGSMPLTLELQGADGPVRVPLSLHDGVARASVPWEGKAPKRVAVDAAPHRVARTRVRAAVR